MKILFGKFVTSKKIKEKSKKGYLTKMFDPNYYFIDVLPVSPNRFRPES